MAKSLGRKITLERDGAPIANIRTKSLSINRELVDTTDDDSSGWAEHLDEAGQVEVTMSVEGVFADDTVLQEALDPASGNKPHTLIYPDGSEISGDFGIASFEQEAEYNAVTTYSFELRASGEVTRTAGTTT